MPTLDFLGQSLVVTTNPGSAGAGVVLGFTMGSWIHNGFSGSRWVPWFTMGSQVHVGFWEEAKAARRVALNF